MPQSLAKIHIHIVFSTKHRVPFIDEKLSRSLFAYLASTSNNLNCHAVQVGGYRDHVHILCELSRTITIARLVEEVKRESSKWVKMQGEVYDSFYWQSGYGAFAVAQSHVKNVIQYIRNQETHHKKLSFKDEYKYLLQKNEVVFDERYVWD